MNDLFFMFNPGVNKKAPTIPIYHDKHQNGSQGQCFDNHR